jgi:hypothetical protein
MTPLDAAPAPPAQANSTPSDSGKVDLAAFEAPKVVPQSSYGGLIVAGLGLGWLMGLSASPVLNTVVTAVVAGILGVVAALAGIPLKDSLPGGVPAKLDPTRINTWPVAFLMLALTVGSCLGIVARTHDWFSPGITSIVQSWKDAGLDEKAVTARVFENRYPKSGSGSNIDRSVLFSAESKQNCAKLKDTPDADLRREMLGSTLPGVAAFAAKIQDPAALRAALETLVVCE